ncbi:hypothetical protein ACBQ54_00360 [Providencia vermicola]|uniref:hypothetical protein n=1 Tax=Providencia vermicola TaxID=333965 RepID=UPI0035248E6F
MFGEVAATQFDDWKGSLALDKKELKSISSWAKEKNILYNNERILGANIYFSEPSNKFTITFKVSSATDDKIKKSQDVKSLIYNKEITLTPHQLIDLLVKYSKRINIILSAKDFD